MQKHLFVILALIGALTNSTYAQNKPASAQSGFSGTVVETTNVANYTYVQIDTGKEKIWAAAPRVQVKVGDKVTVPSGMPMKDFQSPSLKRKFDMIYFVGTIDTPSSGQQATQNAVADPHAALKNMSQDPHAGLPKKAPATPLTFFGITTPKGGVTIKEVFEQKAKLGGKKVLIRGKVAKYNSEVMHKNWLHLQDGTGVRGANDLTVTTTDTAAPGDTVLVEGVLALNKDFGYGYKYDLLLENAKVTVEKKAKQ